MSTIEQKEGKAMVINSLEAHELRTNCAPLHELRTNLHELKPKSAQTVRT